MARPERFELPTLWFVARYSIQLSYGRVIKARIMAIEPGDVNPFPRSPAAFQMGHPGDLACPEVVVARRRG